MKQFLLGEAKDKQEDRIAQIPLLANVFADMLDWEEGLTAKELVQAADRLVKMVKKAKKVWLRGGFVDCYNMGHDDEPPFAGPAGDPIPEFPLTDNFRMATIKRPKTRHLKVKKK